MPRGARPTATAAKTISIPFPPGGFPEPAVFKIDSRFGPGGKTYVVIWTHTSAFNAGLREGMQVVSIYGKPIKNTQTANDLLFIGISSSPSELLLLLELDAAAAWARRFCFCNMFFRLNTKFGTRNRYGCSYFQFRLYLYQ